MLKIFFFLLSNLAYAEQTRLPSPSSEKSSKAMNSLEFEYRLFSPEILYHQGDDSVAMTPKSAGQPGLRFSRGNLSLAFNQSAFSESSQSSGFDLAYNWDRSFFQAYHVWAKGYEVQLNPDSSKKINLGDRDDMTGTSDGLLFLQGLDESSHFSMLTDRGPRDQESLETPLLYIYQILLDRSTFEDSTAFAAGSDVRRKERISLLPGLGAMISQSTPVGYAFTACSLGLGILEEKMTNTTGTSEKKSDGVYALSCLVNLVMQKAAANLEAGEARWYGGMSGQLQLIQPFDDSLLAQRMFLVSAFIGAQF